MPYALTEELQRPVEGLSLYVLGHGDGDGAGLGRVGQHAHGVEQGRDQLLGAVDAVEEARDRTEAVVNGHL